ncbi:MAG: CAP domain-containing protein [Thermotaleaceae bacterium]
MKKIIIASLLAFPLLTTIPMTTVEAANTTYTVRSGDTMYKIATRHGVGLTTLLNNNKQISNPNAITPGMRINIPTTNTQPTATTPTTNTVSAFEQEVVRLVNVERGKQGLAPLKLNTQLAGVARAKSADMRDNGYFSHTSPTYGSPFDMMKRFGIKYSYAGENIAMGQKTPEEVMKGWMNSPGHRNNILSSNFTEIGVGYVVNGKGTAYWTQMFIKP